MTTPVGTFKAAKPKAVTAKVPAKASPKAMANSAVYLTGQGLADAVRQRVNSARAKIIEKEVASALEALRADWVPTQDRDDHAHTHVARSGEEKGCLIPARELEQNQPATPRRYPRALMTEMIVAGRGGVGGVGCGGVEVRLFSIDAACEALAERVGRLAAQGIPVGYLGSVTGANANRSLAPRESPLDYFDAERIAKSQGKELRDLTRGKTGIRMTPDERRLQREASRMIKQHGGL